MKYFGLYFIGFLLLGFMFVQCKKPYIITESNSARILQTLSSDEMRGRRVLTPDIDRAAQFIAAEFGNAGLSTFGDLDTYIQPFQINELKMSTAEVVVRGETLEPSRYGSTVNQEQIEWNRSSVKTADITTDDNFRRRVFELSASEEDLVVFVDEAHSEVFERFMNYFSRPTRFLGDNSERGAVMFILSNDRQADFSIRITAERTQKPMNNVVGVIEGRRTDEFVLFSAHYDHLGIRTAVDGDSVANGANDNASGVTAVIELANYFKHERKPERTLVFVAFTAEEIGGYGSKYFSKQMDPEQITTMFNIEMIGKPAVSGPNSAWITGYDLSTFGEILTNSVPDASFRFYADPYPQQQLFYRSDNETLARLGVPAHTISTTPIDVDTDYHSVTDEFETINVSHMTNTIRAIAHAAQKIISGKETPSRLDPNQLN